MVIKKSHKDSWLAENVHQTVIPAFPPWLHGWEDHIFFPMRVLSSQDSSLEHKPAPAGIGFGIESRTERILCKINALAIKAHYKETEAREMMIHLGMAVPEQSKL